MQLSWGAFYTTNQRPQRDLVAAQASFFGKADWNHPPVRSIQLVAMDLHLGQHQSSSIGESKSMEIVERLDVVQDDVCIDCM